MKNVTKNKTALFVTHGYARCSTDEERQDIDRQIRELKRAGADRVWLEYEHGDSPIKEQQEAMFEAVKPGDTVITLEVPRLCCSTKQLCEIIDTIQAKRLRLIIVGSITMDCRIGQPDPMIEAFLQIAGVFSQLELSMIRAHVRSGWQTPKQKENVLAARPYRRNPSRTHSIDTTANIRQELSMSASWRDCPDQPFTAISTY